jgi:hypothetical protein
MGRTGNADGVQERAGPPEAEAATAPAWEQIEIGRYMPRRIRGSFLGRELG